MLALAVGELDGRLMAVIGGDDGTVRLWDLTTGGPQETATEESFDWVDAMAVGELDGEAVAVVAERHLIEEGTLRVVVPTSGGHPRADLPGDDAMIIRLAIGTWDGRPVCVAASGFPTALRAWDLRIGRPTGKAVTVGRLRAVLVTGTTRPQMTALAVGQVDATPVAVTGGLDRRLRVWDLAAGLRGARTWHTLLTSGD
jgi:WD40 repeat protein